MRFKCTLATVLLSFAITLPVQAVLVDIRISGDVYINEINAGVLQGAESGDAVEVVFQVDSNVFTDSSTRPARGYTIIAPSFRFTAGSATVGLADPLPSAVVPYFVIHNDDWDLDSFVLGTDIDSDAAGVPSDSSGEFGPLSPYLWVDYDDDPLASLDILGALGSYDFGGLFSFGFGVDDGSSYAMLLNFHSMTITAVPLPTALWLMCAAGFSLLGLRKHPR